MTRSEPDRRVLQAEGTVRAEHRVVGELEKRSVPWTEWTDESGEDYACSTLEGPLRSLGFISRTCVEGSCIFRVTHPHPYPLKFKSRGITCSELCLDRILGDLQRTGCRGN